MGVCTAVAEMALAIDTRFGGDDPKVRSTAQVVASMPQWSAQRRLDLWEEQVQEVLPAQAESTPMGLLDVVFEFGRFNLYGAFQAEQTAEEFRRVAAQLSRHGLEVDQHQSVVEW